MDINFGGFLILCISGLWSYHHVLGETGNVLNMFLDIRAELNDLKVSTEYNKREIMRLENQVNECNRKYENLSGKITTFAHFEKRLEDIENKFEARYLGLIKVIESVQMSSENSGHFEVNDQRADVDVVVNEPNKRVVIVENELMAGVDIVEGALKLHVDGDENQLMADVDGVENQLMADVGGVKNKLMADIDYVDNQLMADVDVVENQLMADVDGVKNKLMADVDVVENQLIADVDCVKNKLMADVDGFENQLMADVDVVENQLMADVNVVENDADIVEGALKLNVVDDESRSDSCNSEERQHSNKKRIIPVTSGPTINTKIAFSAYISQESVDLVFKQTLPFDRTLTNVGHSFNPTTHVFTCPVDGIYFFAGSLATNHQSKNVIIEIVKDGSRLAVLFSKSDGDASKSRYTQGSTSVVAECNKGEKVWVQLALHLSGNVYVTVVGRDLITFSGFLISDL